jgi:hypothetical protein
VSDLTADDIFGGSRVATDSEPLLQPYKTFTAFDGRYLFAIVPPGISFELDRARRDRHQHLHGELTVSCDFPKAKTIGGVISVASFNASDLRARRERAALLTERASHPTLDWFGYLEEFCQRIGEAERDGAPAKLLSTLAKPTQTEDLRVEQDWCVLRQHPVILFGDGSSGKSYLALYAAGRLVERGHRVLYCDWELAGDTHRARLERLFGPTMPAVWYVRCEHPLIYEIDRLKRIVQDRSIDYVVCDSVAFASAGPPEDAEVAAAYFRAVRQFGPIGSLHVAHVSKAENGDKRPFGSAFWHNSARATWHIAADDLTAGDRRMVMTLTPRKANLTGKTGPLCVQMRFAGGSTEVSWLPYAPPAASEVAQIAQARRRTH